MANTNGFIKMAVGALVVIIVAAGVILPLFASAEITAGDAITKTNSSLVNDLAGYYDEDVTIVITSPTNATKAADGTITINDYEMTIDDNIITVPFMINGGSYLQASAASSNVNMGLYRFYPDGEAQISGNLSFGYTYTLTYDHSAGTISLTSLDLSDAEATPTTILEDYPADFFFGIKDNGEYSHTRQTAGSGSTAFQNMFITQASIDNRTAGLFRYDGNVTVDGVSVAISVVMSKYGASSWAAVDGYSIDAAVSVSGLVLADGTTDIYTGGTPTLTITVTNDDTSESNTVTATPEASWVLHKASGHATSGLNYTLVGILPVIILVGVLMMVVTAFISNRRA